MKVKRLSQATNEVVKYEKQEKSRFSYGVLLGEWTSEFFWCRVSTSFRATRK
jgi:hypothetical protein